MKKYLIIKADTNDADYTTEKNVVTDEILEELQPMIDAVKANKGKYTKGDMSKDGSDYEYYTNLLSEDQYDLFDQYVPHGEYGVHTIINIELLEVAKETILYSRWG